jgi:hypothetical protein
MSERLNKVEPKLERGRDTRQAMPHFEHSFSEFTYNVIALSACFLCVFKACFIGIFLNAF